MLLCCLQSDPRHTFKKVTANSDIVTALLIAECKLAICCLRWGDIVKSLCEKGQRDRQREGERGEGNTNAHRRIETVITTAIDSCEKSIWLLFGISKCIHWVTDRECTSCTFNLKFFVSSFTQRRSRMNNENQISSLFNKYFTHSTL